MKTNDKGLDASDSATIGSKIVTNPAPCVPFVPSSTQEMLMHVTFGKHHVMAYQPYISKRHGRNSTETFVMESKQKQM